MYLIYIGIALFGGLHLYSSLLSPVRDRLKAWLGENRYKGGYAIISLIGVVLMGWGYVQTRYDGVMAYEPASWTRHLTMLLVLLAFILIASNGGNGYIRKWLQHPFSIGICLWAIGHLLANGKLPVVWIAGTMLVLGVVDIISSSLRKPRAAFEPQASRDVKAVVAGVIVYAVFLLGFHPYILGVPILR